MKLQVVNPQPQVSFVFCNYLFVDVELIKNNAKIGAQIAKKYCEQCVKPYKAKIEELRASDERL